MDVITTQIPDFSAVAEVLATLGVPTTPLLYFADREGPGEQVGIDVDPNRLTVSGRHVWMYFERYGDGNWCVCVGTYPGLERRGIRRTLQITDVSDVAEIAARMKAAVDGAGEHQPQAVDHDYGDGLPAVYNYMIVCAGDEEQWPCRGVLA